jgi:hypothetical protein
MTVHLSIILAIDQLNAQILFCNKFIIFLYTFRALLCSSAGGQIVLYSIWYRHSVGGRPVRRLREAFQLVLSQLVHRTATYTV